MVIVVAILGATIGVATLAVAAPGESSKHDADPPVVKTSLKMAKDSASGVLRARIPSKAYKAALASGAPMYLHTKISYRSADGHAVSELTATPLAALKADARLGSKEVAVTVPVSIDPKGRAVDDALAAIAELLEGVVGRQCLDGHFVTRDLDGIPKNGLQLDCQISDVQDKGEDSEASTVIPRCVMLGATTPDTSGAPCWWVAVDENVCPDTPTRILLHVERNGAEPPLGATTVARCITAE